MDEGSNIEFDNSNGIVTIVVLPQIGLHSCDAHSRNALHLAVLAEEPQRQVNIMNGAVDKDATAELSICNEKARRVELVSSLRPEDGRRANGARREAPVGVTVRGVKPPREAADDLLRRILLQGLVVRVDDGLGDLDAGAEGLLAQHVQALLDGLDGLLRVHRRCARHDDGLQRGLVPEQLVIVQVRP